MTKKFDKTIFDGSWQDYQMSCNGFYCGMNTPPALSGDRTFGIQDAPYAKRMPFLVDEYPACPENWMRSKGRSKSYFVPVEEGKGMWLDFNENANNTHHVAIVISIQGINPVTGLPCEGAALEQYLDKCPKHDIDFGPDRYCEKCGYKWPKQNYLCTTGTPAGSLWIDGFRAADGIVRQYIMTEEKLKGVASSVLGKDSDKRVFAIGISFFLSKAKRPDPPPPQRGHALTEIYHCVAGGSSAAPSAPTPPSTGGIIYGQPQFYSPIHAPINWDVDLDGPCLDSLDMSVETRSLSVDTPKATSQTVTQQAFGRKLKDKNKRRRMKKSALHPRVDLSMEPITEQQMEPITEQQMEPITEQQLAKPFRQVEAKKLEVGAGAKISQAVYDDPEKLDFWRDESEAIICVNYVAEKDAIDIIQQGKETIENHPEGFLQDAPVGN